MEDSKDVGRQFVVSKEGHSHALRHAADKSAFFSAWRKSLQAAAQFPTIRHIYYMAYEAGMLFEHLPSPKADLQGALIWRHEPAWSICFDNDTIYISSIEGEHVLDSLQAWLEATIDAPDMQPVPAIQVQEVDQDYPQAVRAVQAYIEAGDIFQANIARFWSADFAQDKLLYLYGRLRRVNPAPFSCLLDMGDMHIISASPERLFSISSDGAVSARPIAGTRKRSEGEADDALQAELLLSEKERAEHIMLVDLERNDLGRVCEAGSIGVDECMVIEKYATVQHIVSNVRGKLRQGKDLLDVLAAKFPGGTITGCPKVRCMEIIHELEPQPREVYTGGVGYVAWDGSVDMNILIRTFWHVDGRLHWAAGAGIVADSEPEHEKMETEHKAAGLMRVFAHD